MIDFNPVSRSVCFTFRGDVSPVLGPESRSPFSVTHDRRSMRPSSRGATSSGKLSSRLSSVGRRSAQPWTSPSPRPLAGTRIRFGADRTHQHTAAGATTEIFRPSVTLLRSSSLVTPGGAAGSEGCRSVSSCDCRGRRSRIPSSSRAPSNSPRSCFGAEVHRPRASISVSGHPSLIGRAPSADCALRRLRLGVRTLRCNSRNRAALPSSAPGLASGFRAPPTHSSAHRRAR